MRLDRERILDSCLEMFAKYGFRKASLDDIVKPLGVTKAALYHHFPDGKGEIFHAVITREEQRVLDQMRLAIKAGDFPWGQLRRLLVVKLKHLQLFQSLLDVAREAGGQVARISAECEASFHKEERDLIAGILRNAKERGIFKKRDPDRVAYLIQRIQYPLDCSQKGMEKLVEEVLDILLYGIAERVKLNRRKAVSS